MSPVLIIVMTAVTAAFFVLVVFYAVKSQGRRVTTGSEGMKGRHGVVDEACDASGGAVLVNGEIWKATSLTGEPLAKGEKIVVEAIDELVLKVRRM